MTSYAVRLLGLAVMAAMAYGTGLARGVHSVAAGPGAERHGL